MTLLVYYFRGTPLAVFEARISKNIPNRREGTPQRRAHTQLGALPWHEFAKMNVETLKPGLNALSINVEAM